MHWQRESLVFESHLDRRHRTVFLRTAIRLSAFSQLFKSRHTPEEFHGN